MNAIIKKVNKIAFAAASEIIRFGYWVTTGKPIHQKFLDDLNDSVDAAIFELGKIASYVRNANDNIQMDDLQMAIEDIRDTLRFSVLTFSRINIISAANAHADMDAACKRVREVANNLYIELERNPRLAPAINLVIAAFHTATSFYCGYALLKAPKQ